MLWWQQCFWAMQSSSHSANKSIGRSSVFQALGSLRRVNCSIKVQYTLRLIHLQRQRAISHHTQVPFTFAKCSVSLMFNSTCRFFFKRNLHQINNKHTHNANRRENGDFFPFCLLIYFIQTRRGAQNRTFINIIALILNSI